MGEGDSGSIVELLQHGLRRAGITKAVPDGSFGPNTAEHLRIFQRENGLKEDAICGPATWAVLYPYLIGTQMHVVKPGEKQAGIAGNAGIRVESLRAANPGLGTAEPEEGQVLKVPTPHPVVPDDIQMSFDLLNLLVDGLQARYPFVSVHTIGQSVMGRPIYRLTLGQGSTHCGYSAAHHANEWLTCTLVMKFLEQYAKGYAENSTFSGVPWSRLYHNYTLDILPLINPDGVDLVTDALAHSNPYWIEAKEIADAFPQLPFPNGWKANIRGVDLNLQYPASWEQAKEIKYKQGYDRPAPRDFVGEAPLTEPESIALAAYTKQADYDLILAYHSQGKLIFWKYKNYNPAGSYVLALRMQAVSGYIPMTTPDESANAGYKDWFIQEYNRPGYTIEVGTGSSPLPLEQFPEIYENNLGILLLGMIGLS
jgi:g-D-glutamyl-meso-diaminopimelate peptidase